MRCCLPLFLILAAGTARAADAPKPKTLTPQEIADGWIMLFDGESTFGWKTDGDVKAADGEIRLAGDKSASIQTPVMFRSYDLRFEFFLETVPRFRLRNFGGWGHFGSGALGVWQGFEFRVVSDDTATKHEFVRIEPSGLRVGSHSSGQRQKSLTAVGFATADGGKLSIRNVRLRPLGLDPVFNGKDLTGWKQFTANEKQAKSKFTITPEGWINVKNGPGDLQTEKEWKDFVFQGECISNGKACNSGVFFRCIPGQYQQGYEYQIQNGYKDNNRTKPADYGTGAIYRRAPARKVVPNDHEWFTMTLIAQGNHFSTWVNGYQTVDWTDTRPESDNARNGCKLGAGPISFQGHDKTTDLSFRNLRMAELKKN